MGIAMLKWLFIAVHITLAVVLFSAGIAEYRAANARTDAGVTALFCAFWFGFGGIGFYLRNAWVVTVANTALCGLALLYLFLASVDQYSRGGGVAPIPWASIPVVLGALGYLLASEVCAIVLVLREAARRQAEKKNRHFGDRRIRR